MSDFEDISNILLEQAPKEVEGAKSEGRQLCLHSYT